MNHQQFIDPYTLVTETIIAQLEKGVVPWHCPWRRHIGKPRNFHSGLEYRGINIILLGIQRFASPYWMTWKQIKQRGGSVKKGEHGSLVVKYGKFEKKKDEDNGAGEEEKKQSAYLKGYKVFNALQIEGIEFPAVESQPQMGEPERIARAETIINDMPSPPVISSVTITNNPPRISGAGLMPSRTKTTGAGSSRQQIRQPRRRTSF